MYENPGNFEPENLPSESAPLINKRDLPAFLPPPLVENIRPDIKWPLDHYLQELKYLRPVETSGLFGQGLLGLNKPAIVREENNTVIEQVENVNTDLKIDGIYTRSVDQLTANLQRYEQRLLREKQLTFFNRSNWQLRIDSDLTTHQLSHPIDISLERNPAIELKQLSAVLCHRNNVSKNKYYRLDLHIGTLNFKDHPLFSREDILASEMQYMYYTYEKRVGMCLVDHLQDRLDSLNLQLTDKEEKLRMYMQAPSTTQQEKNKLMIQEVELLRKHLEDTHKKLNDEKAAIQEQAEALYNKWTELKELRAANGYTSTCVKLGVRQYHDVKQDEYDFFLQPQEPSADTTILGVRIPNIELSRRKSIQAYRVFLRILVNGIYVARTTKKFMKWPQFQVSFSERFQLHLFSRPVKIRLEVCSGFTFPKTLARMEFNPPGLNVSALTSTAKIYKKLEFESIQAINDPKVVQNLNRKIAGSITLKSYWEGQSDKMPPIRFEDLGAMPKKEVIEKGEIDFFIDVNDPRNKDLVDDLRQKHNKAIQEMLRKDSLFPHHRFAALREIFMKERFRSVELCKYPIPLLERDIKNIPDFMRFLSSLKDIKTDYAQTVYFLLQKYKLMYSNDAETKQRLIDLMEYFVEKQNQVKLGIQKSLYSLPTVVREYVFIDVDPFGQCIKLFFTPRRKLLPRRNNVRTVSGAGVGTCKISIIIYKGVNIPVRDEAWSIRYPQVERFYQPVPPAYKTAMGEPLPPNQTYNSQFPQYRTGSSYNPQYMDQYRNSPRNSQYQSEQFRGSPRASQYPGRSQGSFPNRPPSPDRSAQIPPVTGQGYQTVERVQSFIEVRLYHQGDSTVVRTAPFDGTNPE